MTLFKVNNVKNEEQVGSKETLDVNEWTSVDGLKKEEKIDSKNDLNEWSRSLPDEIKISTLSLGVTMVHARKDIPEGTRFGPFIDKWCSSSDSGIGSSIVSGVGGDFIYNVSNRCDLKFFFFF